MKIVFEYIKYRWNAKGRHGIHSPFVYRFVNECLTQKLSKEFKQIRTSVFRKFKYDARQINVKDFGAGSKKLLPQRKVSSIFRNSSSTGKYAELLFQLSSFKCPKNILELGTSLGIGTMHLHYGCPEAAIYSIEGCPKTLEVAKENFIGDKSKVHFIQSDFHSFFKDLINKKYDLVFIDGHHDGKALISYLDLLRNYIYEETIIILDDIRWSDSMYESWKEIINNPKYHLTIDLFRMGIIALRPGQEKEHFIIKL